MELKAPFPYFGGKSKVADMVWSRLGDCPNYIEPFFGSGAVLLGRPDESGIETVNDIDGYLANFWRAIQAEPGKVAELMDWPVNEVDLEARHKWLVEVNRKREHLQRMKDDPDYYDVKIAAWWCWGLCAWIGRGWCGGEWYGPEYAKNRGAGINVRDPVRGGKLPHLGPSRGVHRQRPHLGNAGQGVHSSRGAWLIEWMTALSNRLRRVRVCCGDWSRVCGPSPTVKNGLTGVFLDPPYSAEAGRDNDIYREEDLSVAHKVRAWAIEQGTNPKMRIALCGYEGEHAMPDDWECVVWKTRGCYANQYKGQRGTENAHRERIWFSPHCVRIGDELELR